MAAATTSTSSPSLLSTTTTTAPTPSPRSLCVAELLGRLLQSKPRRGWYAQSFGRHMPRVTNTWTLEVGPSSDRPDTPRAFVRMVVAVYQQPLIRQFDSSRDECEPPYLQCASGDIEVFLLDEQEPGPDYLRRLHGSSAVWSLSQHELALIDTHYGLRYFSPACACAKITGPQSPKRVNF